MKDETLRAQVLEILGLTNATKEDQDASLFNIESVANGRMGLAIPELLTEEQLAQVETMRQRGDAEDAIMDWVADQVPDYMDTYQALILDVADEAAASINDTDA